MHRPLMLTIAGVFVIIVGVLLLRMGISVKGWNFSVIVSVVATIVFAAYLDGRTQGLKGKPSPINGYFTGLRVGTKYETLSSTPYKGSPTLYYNLVEALDGPDKGNMRCVQSGEGKLPQKFIYHTDKTAVALA